MATETDPHDLTGPPHPAADPTPTTPTATAIPPPGASMLPGSPNRVVFLASAVLSLACGGLGAWAYGAYAAVPRAVPASDPPTADRPAPAPEDGWKEFNARFDHFEARLNRLQDQVSALPKDPAPSELDALKARVAGLDARLAAVGKAPESARTGVTSPRSGEGRPAPTAIAFSKRESARLAPEYGDVRGAAWERGNDLFARGRYAGALEIFRQMQADRPDDARVWYFSALASGFATRDWSGQTQRLALRGVERERAGTPGTDRIDSAFTSLTQATGKDWLAAYRRRAKK
jgi:hypothetical protein